MTDDDIKKLRELAEIIFSGEHLINSGMCSDLDLVDARFVFLEMASTQVPALLTALDEARAEAARLREALIKARKGLSDGVNQYASRNFGGAIIPGDEQYPWVRSMQIGLDAARQALEVKP